MTQRALHSALDERNAQELSWLRREGRILARLLDVMADVKTLELLNADLARFKRPRRSPFSVPSVTSC